MSLPVGCVAELHLEAFLHAGVFLSQLGLFDFTGGIPGDVAEEDLPRPLVSGQPFAKRQDLFF